MCVICVAWQCSYRFVLVFTAALLYLSAYVQLRTVLAWTVNICWLLLHALYCLHCQFPEFICKARSASLAPSILTLNCLSSVDRQDLRAGNGAEVTLPIDSKAFYVFGTSPSASDIILNRPECSALHVRPRILSLVLSCTHWASTLFGVLKSN